MFSFLIFLFILGVLITVHEFGHFIAARSVGVRVEKFSFGFGPLLFKRKRGDTEYCIRALALGGYVKMAGDTAEEHKGKDYEYMSKAPGLRFKIIFFGPLLNYILGFLFFWLIFFVGYPTFTTRVGGLVEGYGAAAAGLKENDVITGVEASPVLSWEQMQRKISEAKGEKVLLTVRRGAENISAEVAIRQSEIEGPGGKARRGLIGITPSDDIITLRHGFLQSFWLGAQKTVELSAMTYKGIWWLVTGKVSMRDSMTGPLGIFYITSKAASLGIVALLHLMAVLSISLAIFNLLPLPILDGGHILFLLIEKLRGRALSLKIEDAANRAGLVLIICLAIFVTYNDMLRLFGDKIQAIFK